MLLEFMIFCHRVFRYVGRVPRTLFCFGAYSALAIFTDANQLVKPPLCRTLVP
jgi:hypothetical protein